MLNIIPELLKTSYIQTGTTIGFTLVEKGKLRNMLQTGCPQWTDCQVDTSLVNNF